LGLEAGYGRQPLNRDDPELSTTSAAGIGGVKILRGGACFLFVPKNLFLKSGHAL
jgi:hypothetical protein